MSIRIEFQYEKEKLDKIVVDACDWLCIGVGKWKKKKVGFII